LGDLSSLKGNDSKAVEYWNKAKKLGISSADLNEKILKGSL